MSFNDMPVYANDIDHMPLNNDIKERELMIEQNANEDFEDLENIEKLND